jgi:hypothetical protein
MAALLSIALFPFSGLKVERGFALHFQNPPKENNTQLERFPPFSIRKSAGRLEARVTIAALIGKTANERVNCKRCSQNNNPHRSTKFRL